MAPRDSVLRVEQAILAAGGTFHQRGADVFRSLGICHEARSSESLVIFYHPDKGNVGFNCWAGCSHDDVREFLGLSKGDLWDEPREDDQARMPRPVRPVIAPPEPVIYPAAPPDWCPEPITTVDCRIGDEYVTHDVVAEYLYLTEDERIAFGVVRCSHKCFKQWRPHAEADGHRLWRVKGKNARGQIIATVAALPYRLPELLAGIRAERTVWCVEGEKDADRLVAEGMVATCNAGGGRRGSWTAAHAAHFKGADVRIVADRDETGRHHAEEVVESLMPIARSIDVVQAAHGKDVSDHLDAGGTLTDLIPVWEPKPLQLHLEEAS